jgi:hypothetical protein|tara:strand:- start:2787 stop:3935 length:1149 start_codon:yes stop_codon:yes gene_type:complete
MNVPIWEGSSSFQPGQTPFGFYDYQEAFQIDADKVAVFCANRMGYPLVDIELQSGSFYTAFEEAITIYGNELYAYKIRDNILSFEGLPSGSNQNNTIITPNFDIIFRLSQQYASEAGVGGNVPWYTGRIPLTASVQDYDLNNWAAEQGITGSLGIEITRVFYQESPAITRYYDPYVGTGFGTMNLFDSFGFGGDSPAVNFLMMPLNYDLAVIQQIEMNDMVRMSNYSFEIHNNKVRMFPIPTTGSGHLVFEYMKRNERIESGSMVIPEVVTNVSNVPFANPNYNEINPIGRQWIFEMTLAIAKEMLGYVRGKYSTIPIPNADVTLNQADLIAAGTAEKVALLERLRAYFDETSRLGSLDRRAKEAEAVMIETSMVPYTIYIG